MTVKMRRSERLNVDVELYIKTKRVSSGKTSWKRDLVIIYQNKCSKMAATLDSLSGVLATESAISVRTMDPQNEVRNLRDHYSPWPPHREMAESSSHHSGLQP